MKSIVVPNANLVFGLEDLETFAASRWWETTSTRPLWPLTVAVIWGLSRVEGIGQAGAVDRGRRCCRRSSSWRAG